MKKKIRAGAHLVPKKPMFVYFIQCGDERGPIKIGYADNVGTRKSKLQNGCPYPLILLHWMVVDDHKAIEYALHRRFAAQRMRGEWFEWSADLEATIDELRTTCAALMPRLDGIVPPPRRSVPTAGPPQLRIVK